MKVSCVSSGYQDRDLVRPVSCADKGAGPHPSGFSRRLPAMALEFVDYRRGPADKYSWAPRFDTAITYEHPHWWDEVRYYVNDPWFVQVVDEDGVEVARVELDDPGGISPKYTEVPELGDDRLEIQFIEVPTASRRRGIGTRVVQGLAERHRDRRLFAYSENADEFWTRLGWDRFNHPEDGWRPLFIQPVDR